MTHDRAKDHDPDPVPGTGSASLESPLLRIPPVADEVLVLGSPLSTISTEEHALSPDPHEDWFGIVPHDALDEISGLMEKIFAVHNRATGSPQDSVPLQEMLHQIHERLNRQDSERTIELERANHELKRRLSEHETEAQALRHRVEASDEVVQAIPYGLLLYQYQPPGELFFLSCNTEAGRLTGLQGESWRGAELDETWPDARSQGLTQALLTAARSGEPFETDKAYFRQGKVQRLLKVRAFPMPGNRLGVAFDEATHEKSAGTTRWTAQDEQSRTGKESVSRLFLENLQPAENVTEGMRTDVVAFQAGRVFAQEQIACDIARCLSHPSKMLEEAGRRATSRLEAGYLSLVKVSLQQIEDSTRQISEIVTRLRQFSGVPPDASALERRVFDVSDTVGESVDALRETVTAGDGDRNGDWAWELLLAPGCHMLGEQSEMVDVVTILLRNAVEASAGGAGITVRTGCEDDSVLLQVIDKGVGIPDGTKDKVFVPFWTSKASHTGLGLAAAAGIVRRYGGTIEVIAHEGRGASFTLRMPRAGKPEAEMGSNE
jgi:signal transduction histidine kinase